MAHVANAVTSETDISQLSFTKRYFALQSKDNQEEESSNIYRNVKIWDIKIDFERKQAELKFAP